MSDSFREHRPLLREDISDEEFQQEFRPPPRPMGCRGRARNTAKGAASIIKNWPDYWLSSVNYSYVGMGMFALLTFILYSSVLTYTMLPADGLKPIPQYVTERKNTLPEVFMHVVVNNEKEIDINKYLPYVEIIADKYLHYQFNLIFMKNDTLNSEQAIHNARLNNEDAMNSLWKEDNVLEPDKLSSKTKSNIFIQSVCLSSYLDNSPIQQYWKQLPNQLIEFLVRAVSIWDKGGIAFSPIILTPRSPHAIYIEKLYSLLASYEDHTKPNNIPAKPIKNNSKIHSLQTPKLINNHKRKYKKKVNNIRDIIEAYETEVPGQETQLEVLSEAEDRQEMVKTKMEPPNTESVVISTNYNVNRTDNFVMDHSIEHNQAKTSNIMSSVFDFLFHDKSNRTAEAESIDSPTKRGTKTISTEHSPEITNKDKVIQPMIISAPTKFEKLSSNVDDNGLKSIDVDNLTIDLKGNILATKSSCHAFLGSVFSNVKHRTEEDSLKEFIIGELSLFCNGLLSTCRGIDVILL